jgi:hypothetical protein
MPRDHLAKFSARLLSEIETHFYHKCDLRKHACLRTFKAMTSGGAA